MEYVGFEIACSRQFNIKVYTNIVPQIADSV